MRTGLADRLATTLPQFVMVLLFVASTQAVAQTARKCDVNGDEQINQTDINLIIAARNTPATGPNDRRDADNNGIVNALDARTCTLRCTLAGCALSSSTNTAPVATNDSYSKPENTTLVVMAPGVLVNDTDAQGNPLTAAVVTGPASGTLVLSTNGSFSYMPAPNFAGTVTFTYRANDGALNSNTATVTIDVAPVADSPATLADSYSTPEDTPLTVASPGVLGNDDVYVSNPDGAPDALLVSGPTSGTLVLNADGSFTFAPAAGFTGASTFTYRASNGAMVSSVTPVTINVTSANGSPVANADAYGTDEDMPLKVAAPGILANDTDPGGGALTAVLVTPPAGGTLLLDANGAFTYTPAADFTGAASFTYRALNALLSSDPTTVSLTVLPMNNAPVAANDSYSTPMNGLLTVAAPGILANDTDQLGSGLTVVPQTLPANGALSVNPNGGFTYAPNSNFTGGDSFTYRAHGNALNSNSAIVTINVSNTAGPCALNAPTVLGGASNVTQPINLGIGSIQLLSNLGAIGAGTVSSVVVPIVEFTANVVSPGSLQSSPAGWTQLAACGIRASARAGSGAAITYVIKGQKICFDLPPGASAAYNALRIAYYDTTLARWVTFQKSVVGASEVCHSSFRLLPSTYALFGANLPN